MSAGVYSSMEDAVEALSNPDAFVSALLEALTPPALTAHSFIPRVVLFTRPLIGPGPGTPQQSHPSVHTHRAPRVLRWMAQVPRLLGGFDPAVLAEDGVLITKRLLHGGAGQDRRLAPRPIVSTMPLAHQHGRDAVGLEVAAVVLAPRLRCSLWVIRHQRWEPDALHLQPCCLRRSPLPMTHTMHPAADRDPFSCRSVCPRLDRHRPMILSGHHHEDVVPIEPPQSGARQNALMTDDLVQAGRASQIGPGLSGRWPVPVCFRCVHRPHLDGQRQRGRRIDQQDCVPAIARDLNLVHPTPLILHPRVPGHLTIPPWRTCWALKASNDIKASALNARLGRAFMPIRANKGFSP